MPPKKTTKTAAAGSATARKTATNLTAAQKRTVAKKPHFKAKFVRMNELRARYRAVGLALKPALTEIANRTTYEIKNDTHYNHQGIKEVEAQLEEVRDRAIANISAQTALRMEAVQRKTEYDMWLVQQERKTNKKAIYDRHAQQLSSEWEGMRPVLRLADVVVFADGDIMYVG